jgi:hypothetical protein
MKIRPMGAELFQVDRQTDMTKLIVTFHNFANAPKMNIAFTFTFMIFLFREFFYWSVEKLLMQEALHCTIQLKLTLKWFTSIKF